MYTQLTECNVNILTPLHLSKQTLTVPLNCTYVDSGNLNALNLAVKKSPSTVLKFSNKYGSTEQLRVKKKPSKYNIYIMYKYYVDR